jgi:hypothetical protein
VGHLKAQQLITKTKALKKVTGTFSKSQHFIIALGNQLTVISFTLLPILLKISFNFASQQLLLKIAFVSYFDHF